MAAVFLVLGVRGASTSVGTRPEGLHETGAARLLEPMQLHAPSLREDAPAGRIRNQTADDVNSAAARQAETARLLEPLIPQTAASSAFAAHNARNPNRLVAMLLDRGPHQPWVSIGRRVVNTGRRVRAPGPGLCIKVGKGSPTAPPRPLHPPPLPPPSPT